VTRDRLGAGGAGLGCALVIGALLFAAVRCVGA
jgi:hypothetical protein